jgi:hypothetical protein
VIRAKDFLPDGERPPVERLGLRATVLTEAREPLEPDCRRRGETAVGRTWRARGAPADHAVEGFLNQHGRFTIQK